MRYSGALQAQRQFKENLRPVETSLRNCVVCNHPYVNTEKSSEEIKRENEQLIEDHRNREAEWISKGEQGKKPKLPDK